MSHVVAVWTGVQPADDRDAAATYDGLVQRKAGAPTPSLVEFVEELVLPEHDDATSPWAGGPLRENVQGDLLHLGLVYNDLGEAALAYVAERGPARGLVCFEPDFGTLLQPPPPRRRGPFRRH